MILQGEMVVEHRLIEKFQEAMLSRPEEEIAVC
jgi:hypothetical protein